MPNTLSREELFCLEGCRSYKQYYEMRQGFASGKCAFCDIDRKFNEIEYEDEHVLAWQVPDNYLRKELAYHLIVIPKRHVRFMNDLTSIEMMSILNAHKVLQARHRYTGGMLHVREGDMRLNAGTVPHLHFNTFVPNKTGEVRIPVFKSSADREENEKRAAEFATQYEAGEVP